MDYYERQGQLVAVDGMGAIDDVNRRILASLDELDGRTKVETGKHA
jgi:hypothetical protein